MDLVCSVDFPRGLMQETIPDLALKQAQLRKELKKVGDMIIRSVLWCVCVPLESIIAT